MSQSKKTYLVLVQYDNGLVSLHSVDQQSFLAAELKMYSLDEGGVLILNTQELKNSDVLSQTMTGVEDNKFIGSSVIGISSEAIDLNTVARIRLTTDDRDYLNKGLFDSNEAGIRKQRRKAKSNLNKLDKETDYTYDSNQ